MFVIKNANTGLFAKHTETASSYPWKMVSNIKDATAYNSFNHANEVAFWNLDHTEKWLIVSTVTGKQYEKEMAKYYPV
ncbi:hypothetical protein HYI36_00835 [Bacillus sp. Gen3]|uniref:hypothetical protein n=1 Tax=Heyndrickxia oleronia TaxID=38875 RepID=UPI0015D0ECC0|nr:hypothetical protein [Bacillus sp. Gen3]